MSVACGTCKAKHGAPFAACVSWASTGIGLDRGNEPRCVRDLRWGMVAPLGGFEPPAVCLEGSPQVSRLAASRVNGQHILPLIRSC